MGQDPSAIREEIEQTRAQMGETVEAIGYKTDVKSRAKESVQDKIGGVRERITGVKDTVGEKTPSTGEMRRGARQAVSVAQANPIGLMIGSLAAGFLIGMLLPSTDVEDEKLGPVADRAREAASEVVDQGKQMAQEVASNVTETAKETVQEQAPQRAEEVKSSMQQQSSP